jgi:hypothetical protein
MEIKNHMPLNCTGDWWNIDVSVADIVGAFGLSLRSISLPHYFVSFYDAPDSGQKQIPLLQSEQLINMIIFSLCIFNSIEKHHTSLDFGNLFYFD